MTAPRRFHHVANGTSTTTTIERAGIPGTRSIWADPLHDGPVPGDVSDAELAAVRTRHLAGPNPDRVNDLFEWRRAIAAHESYDELILWYEHDLFDQLNLIQLLSFVHERLPGDKTVTLICIDSYPGRPHFKGLGELTPGELAPLFDTRQPVTVQQFALAERAWQAFRAPTPEALAQLRHEDTSLLPYLAAALTRFLQEYPWTRDGLSRSERRLLELAGGGGIALWQAFPQMDEGERALHTTDHSLAGTAETLSRTSPSLLTLDLPPAADVLDGFVTLTAAGRSALAGQLDRVSACGLDRWFGGVHLREGGPMWRWDPARHTVVRTDA